MGPVYSFINESASGGRRLFAVLIDPDRVTERALDRFASRAAGNVDLVFVGGSLLTNDHFCHCVESIKARADIPVILFPGNIMQVNDRANAIFFLSLISGRNADLLIGNHVIAAPVIRRSGLEVLPTGYMLIDGGQATTVSYMSNTVPIPRDKHDIAVCTAMAGEMLGHRLIYMDAGSGARKPIEPAMIRKVKEHVPLPLIAGGGIRTVRQATDAAGAGADIIVVGNAIEKDASLIDSIGKAVHRLSAARKVRRKRG